MNLPKALAALFTYVACFFIWRAFGFGWEPSLILAVPTSPIVWALTGRI